MRITIIRDEDTKEILGVYETIGLIGDFKSYYEGNHESYDEYEKDLVNRGAVIMPYETKDV